MIKLENIVLPSPQQWMAIIRGARNPLNSWDRMDSYITKIEDAQTMETADYAFFMGDSDHDLLMRLAKAGKDHRKFMRMIPVFMDIVAPRFWFLEFDTYKIATVSNSCSTMHTIHKKEFTRDDFSCENMSIESVEILDRVIDKLNIYRDAFVNGHEEIDETTGEHISIAPGDKFCWRQMIDLLPQSYNQRRTITLNYEVLSNMYHARKNHKLQEWRTFCEWVESLPYSELITCGGKPEVLYICDGEACGPECPNTDCMYTSDIKHAMHFHSDGEFYLEDYALNSND